LTLQDWIVSENLELQPETQQWYGDYYGQVFKGWFIPPETTEYRFYMSCDDDCRLKLGETPNVIKDPKEIIRVT
jgi:hypothetical protein